MSTSPVHRSLLHRGLHARIPLHMISIEANNNCCIYNGLMNSEPGGLIGNNLCNHHNRIPGRGYASERCLSECITERHSVQTRGYMV
ncbi:hypothetical protein TNCV_2479091 [Trichonephila clavipes]|nr:hypothetical protein TNCV_2479091 [Trichonephila clavipes]